MLPSQRNYAENPTSSDTALIRRKLKAQCCTFSPLCRNLNTSTTMLVLIKCNHNAMGNNYAPNNLIIDQTLRLIWVMPIV